MKAHLVFILTLLLHKSVFSQNAQYRGSTYPERYATPTVDGDWVYMIISSFRHEYGTRSYWIYPLKDTGKWLKQQDGILMVLDIEDKKT